MPDRTELDETDDDGPDDGPDDEPSDGLWVGDHARLRPLRADDLPTLRHWWTDPGLAARSGATLRPGAENPSVDMFRGWTAGSRSAGLGIEARASGELVGHVSFAGVDTMLRSATLAIILGDSHRGKGLQADAVHLATRYGFTAMNLRSIELTAWAAHDNGVEAYAEAGYVEVSRTCDVVFCDGAWHDRVVMRALKSERLCA